MLLTLKKSWSAEGHRFAIWAPESVSIIKHVKLHLDQQLRPFLNRRCAHIRSHGGVKGSIRCAHALSSCCRFVARFDIRSYYESINHKILIDLLGSAGVCQSICNIVSDYLRLPDVNSDGSGMLAGGAISPLLGAVYLTSLDRAMARLEMRSGIRYLRYMDDFLIFTPSRHKLRMAIRNMYVVLDNLKLCVHPQKRFIGQTRKGFDFLGYRIHPDRLLRPSMQSLNRLLERSRRLHEQGAGETRLRQHVRRWHQWLHGGLRGRVSVHGRFTRIWIYILKHLKIIDYQT